MELQMIFAFFFFHPFVHPNCLLVVKTMLYVQQIIVVLFIYTQDNYSSPSSLPLGHMAALWSVEKERNDVRLSGPAIKSCRIYHSIPCLPQIWGVNVDPVTSWRSLGPWSLPATMVCDKVDTLLLFEATEDAGGCYKPYIYRNRALLLSMGKQTKTLLPKYKPSTAAHDLLNEVLKMAYKVLHAWLHALHIPNYLIVPPECSQSSWTCSSPLHYQSQLHC